MKKLSSKLKSKLYGFILIGLTIVDIYLAFKFGFNNIVVSIISFFIGGWFGSFIIAKTTISTDTESKLKNQKNEIESLQNRLFEKQIDVIKNSLENAKYRSIANCHATLEKYIKEDLEELEASCKKTQQPMTIGLIMTSIEQQIDRYFNENLNK